MASQRQERSGGGAAFRSVVSEEPDGGCLDEGGIKGEAEKRLGVERFYPLFLVIKGFWGTAQRKLLSAEFKDILLKLLKCLNAHAASRLHMLADR